MKPRIHTRGSPLDLMSPERARYVYIMAVIELLAHPVPGLLAPLWQKPGIYPKVGLAYYPRGRGWVLAIECHAFCRTTEQLAGRPPWVTPDQVQPIFILEHCEHHPGYLGREVRVGFESGHWCAIAAPSPSDLDWPADA